MLDLVTDETRLLIANARRTAYLGRLATALDSLEERANNGCAAEVDRISLRCTQAELLYLNGQYKAAHEVFTTHLDTISDSIPHSVEIVIGFNRADVASALFDSAGISRFYDLTDELRIAGIEHWDDSAMLSASRSAQQGKSYESLPMIWRELKRTYELGRWSAFRQASRNMAEECIRLGELAEAVYHCSMACDANFVKQLSAVLLASRQVDLVENALARLMQTANLEAHFKVACVLIQELSDCVPDQLIGPIIRWILPRGCSTDERDGHDPTQETIWRTIASVAARTSSNVAEQIIDSAIHHKAWLATTEEPNQFIRAREEIIDAVNQTVTALPMESLGPLADDSIPLATTRQNFKDFSNAVNLLGHIVHRAPDSVRETVRAALYPKGKGIPPVLMQTASHFGQEIVNKGDQLDAYAEAVADNLGKVVQRIPAGDDPLPVNGRVMTWTSTKADHQLVVHLISADEIRGMGRNRRQFKPESVHLVVASLVAGAGDPQNLLDNRIVFMDCIKDFADCLDESSASSVYKVLAPIASGDIDISPDVPQAEARSHPLSRAQFKGATRDQVCGDALFVLACIEHQIPGIYGVDLQKIVERALNCPSPEIRKSAFAAVREIPTLTESTWMPLLLGTRDPDEDAAALAFNAIATKKEAHLTRPQWRMLAYSLRTAQLYVSIKLRRAAAAATAALTSQAPTKHLRAEFEQIRQTFLQDVSYSVRTAAE